ncbi:MAG: acyl-CoA dehydrogenase family protein [Candidatus Geothermincolia bacterium]
MTGLPTAFEMPTEVADLREWARRLVREQLLPFEREIEETDDIPQRVKDVVRESGLHGLQVPAEYGGMGLGMFAACVVTEELAWMSQVLVRLVCGDALGIGIWGNEALHEKYLRRIARGDLITAFALTEPDAGSDATAIRCRAVRDGDSFVLEGEKIMVTAGDIAGLVLVFAVTDPEAGPGGITALVVESAFDGFEVARIEPKMGLRGIHTAALRFDGCRVPSENVLGVEGQGFVLAMQLLDLARIRYNGAASVGNAQRLLEMSVSYAKQRRAFGTKIGNHEGVGFMLARLALDVHASRLMVYDVARKVDMLQPVTMESAMTKLFATEAADRVADMAVQVHGGHGYMKDDVIERFYRDARLGRIWDGTSEIQQLIISRLLLA